MHRVNQNRHADEKELVGEREIEDVKICHCLHFTESENDTVMKKTFIRIYCYGNIFIFNERNFRRKIALHTKLINILYNQTVSEESDNTNNGV